MKRIQRTGSRYIVEFQRSELWAISAGLGWADALIGSEAAFPDYVHCTRVEFRALRDELTNVVQAPEGEPGEAEKCG